jgi:hypothetical protein
MQALDVPERTRLGRPYTGTGGGAPTQDSAAQPAG